MALPSISFASGLSIAAAGNAGPRAIYRIGAPPPTSAPVGGLFGHFTALAYSRTAAAASTAAHIDSLVGSFSRFSICDARSDSLNAHVEGTLAALRAPSVVYAKPSLPPVLPPPLPPAPPPTLPHDAIAPPTFALPPAPAPSTQETIERIMRALSIDELSRLAKAQRETGPPDKSLSSMKGGDITIADLALLRPGAWFNDSIINFYGLLLRASGEAALAEGRRGATWIHSTFFYTRMMQNRTYDYPGIRRWAKSGNRPIDIFAFDRVLVPINRGNTHWALAVIDMVEHTVAYYDSLGGSGEDVLANLIRYLADEHSEKKSAPLQHPFSSARAPPNLPKQHNGSDCGAFVCAFMTCVSFGVEPCEDAVFSQADMKLWRQKIAVSCLDQRLHFESTASIVP